MRDADAYLSLKGFRVYGSCGCRCSHALKDILKNLQDEMVERSKSRSAADLGHVCVDIDGG